MFKIGIIGRGFVGSAVAQGFSQAVGYNAEIRIFDKDPLKKIDSLEDVVKHSEFVFMGGSLIDHGGQNFLEAAFYSKTIIVGPFMYNFISETEEFLKKNALLMVKESSMLKGVFQKLIKSKNKRELFGNNAKKIMESKKDIADHYCKAIQELIADS